MKIREHLTGFKAHVPDPDKLYSVEPKNIYLSWRHKIIKKIAMWRCIGDGEISCLLENGCRLLNLTFISGHF